MDSSHFEAPILVLYWYSGKSKSNPSDAGDLVKICLARQYNRLGLTKNSEYSQKKQKTNMMICSINSKWRTHR